MCSEAVDCWLGTAGAQPQREGSSSSWAQLAHRVDDWQLRLEHFLRHLLREPALDRVVGLVGHLVAGSAADRSLPKLLRSATALRGHDRNLPFVATGLISSRHVRHEI
jgi:hypothetical protein